MTAGVCESGAKIEIHALTAGAMGDLVLCSRESSSTKWPDVNS